jgi:hypothetical protein
MEIRNRWTNACLWTGEIEASGSDRRDLGSAVLAARKEGANLQGANLQRANLQGAYLQGANLQRAKDDELAIACTRILPEGSLIGWKKCAEGRIVKLRIPEDARRSHAFGRKCRAEYVIVIEGEGVSIHDGVTQYRVVESVIEEILVEGNETFAYLLFEATVTKKTAKGKTVKLKTIDPKKQKVATQKAKATQTKPAASKRVETNNPNKKNADGGETIKELSNDEINSSKSSNSKQNVS